MEKEWSDWSFFKEEALSTLPEGEGIYQFRCVDVGGNPLVISRLKAKDQDGIIYIGSSANLRHRLKGFWKTVEQRDRTRHAAAWSYCSFGYDSIFPPAYLQFRYKVTRATTTSEFDLLLEYRRRFADTPPLNANQPPYPRDWKTRIRKMFGRDPLLE